MSWYGGGPEGLAAERMARHREALLKWGDVGYDSNTGACTECGSTVHGARRNQHTNFHANYIHRAEVKDGFAVSAVKWCDLGNHAFKANSPGSQSLNVVNRNEDGTEENVVMDMCGEHAFPTGPRPDKMREVEQSYEQARAVVSAPANAVSAYPHRDVTPTVEDDWRGPR